MLCILYVIAVGTLLGGVGVLAERTLPATYSRRWIWCLTIPISVVLPGLYRVQHNVAVGDVLDARAATSVALLDPAWWIRLDSYGAIINRAWLIASALLLAWGIVSVVRVGILVHAARNRGGAANGSETVDGIPVVVTDSLGPATVGLWRSRVLVPRWVLALPGVQRQYILRHEDEHRRSHDAHLLFLASLSLLLVPWNVALWWQLRRLRLAVEMDCDGRVVRALGDADAYGSLLLTVAQAASRGPRLQPALLGAGAGMLERRLTALLAPRPLRHLQRYAVPAMALVLLIVVLSMPHPVAGSGPDAHAAHTEPTAEVTVAAR